MGLTTTADLARMRAELAELRGDNEVSIVIKRGNATLPAQPVRIARSGSGSVSDSAGGQQATASVVVLGSVTFDVRPEDRFTVAGITYQVHFVRPNRRVMVTAEAIAII